VAETVTVYVPAGVPLAEGVLALEPPPQPLMSPKQPEQRRMRHNHRRSRLFREGNRKKNRDSNPAKLVPPSNRPSGAAGVVSCRAVWLAPVAMVRALVTATAPGVIEAGLKLQEAFEGSPEQLRLTA
jgi:hypothetical protein